jgi:3-methylcrotonyl-CoA carboxylase alpha subunit
VVGLSTNVAFLQRLVKSEAFRTADLDTGLIERNQTVLFPPQKTAGIEAIALAMAALLERETRTRRIDEADRHSPWTHAGGWRLNGRDVRAALPRRRPQARGRAGATPARTR